MTTTTTEKLWDLEIAVQADGSVNLEQGTGNTQYLSLHRSQVQLIAEKVGLLRPIAPDGGAVSGQMTYAEIVREQRRLRTTLLALRDRGETLLRNLEATEQYSRDDLTLESPRPQRYATSRTWPARTSKTSLTRPPGEHLPASGWPSSVSHPRRSKKALHPSPKNLAAVRPEFQRTRYP